MLFRIFHRQSGVDAMNGVREIISIAPPPFKEYARFPRLALPPPRPVTDALSDLLSRRVSERTFDERAEISLADLSDILFAACGLRDAPDGMPARRMYPSGGARNPIECYIAASRVGSLDPAIYHYDIKSHALSRLIAMAHPSKIFEAVRQFVPAQEPAAIVVISSVWGRNYPQYGEYAYRLALAEAGHAMQNLLLAATARSLKSCPAMGFKSDAVSEALGIAGEEEDPLYLALVG